MPTIKSDLTNKNFPNNNNFREIEVPDETGYHPQQTFEGNTDLDIDAINALMAERNMPPVDPKIVSAFNSRQAAARGMRGPIMNDDKKEDLAAFEQQMSNAKRAKISGKERLSPAAKQRIEMLCGISRGSRDVDIDGNVFVLKSLKGKEQRAAVIAASEYDNSIQSPFEIRKQLLARSISDVAGTDLELFLGDSSFDTKLEFIDELPEQVLSKLFSEYLVMVDEMKNKYFLTNDVDAKGVVEDLKK